MTAPRPLRTGILVPERSTRLCHALDSGVLLAAALVGLAAVYFAAQLVSWFVR